MVDIGPFGVVGFPVPNAKKGTLVVRCLVGYQVYRGRCGAT